MKINKKLKVVSLTTLAAACVLSGAFALNANTAAAAEDTFHEVGASIRVANDKGIRFAFGLPEEYTGEGYEIGTLIIPKEVLGADVLNHNDDTADETDVDYLPIACDKNFLPSDKVKGAKEGYKYYNAALTEIPEVNYNTVLVARSYYKNANGEYVYSDVVERSIGYVASAVLNDGYNDTTGIVSAIVNQGFGEETVEVDFEKDLLSVNDTTTFEATNAQGYKAVWSSSDEKVATVDKDGKVTAVKGGETTITAKIGDKSASQQVYVVGDGLYSDQIGTRANGWNFTSNSDWFTMTESNGDMSVAVKLNSNPQKLPMLMVRNMYSKAYYQKVVANGYTKFAFNLAVGGENAANVDDLYVFGKALTSFPKNNDGSYAVSVDTNQFVSYYDTMYTLATSGDAVGAKSSINAMLLAWDYGDTWNTVRNYEFTFSGVAFVEPTLSVDFAEGNTDLVEVGKTTTLTAETNVAGEVEWSTSNAEVATVENGVVTGVKGGVVTITATFCGKSVEKTVYVVGGLNSNQIGTRANGWNYTGNADWFTITENNGDVSVSVKFNSNPQKLPMLMVRNMYSKAYYQKLIDSGYAKLTFMLAVGGDNAADVSDLYVFGKALTSFPKNNDGSYAVSVDTNQFVSYYDTMYTLATSGDAVGAKSSINAMLLAWDYGDTWNTVRNYEFTFSNMAFRQGVLFSDNIGMRVNGWNMTTNTTYMTMDLGANGEMIITANWQAYTNYGPTLVLKNLEDKAYYQNLQTNGYTYLTFDLKVEGEDADKLTDVHILGTAQKVAECEKVDGVYKVKIQLAHIIQFYDTISTLDTSGNQAGQWGSRSAMLLAWRFSTDFATVPEDATRNYVFTISNSAYTKA